MGTRWRCARTGRDRSGRFVHTSGDQREDPLPGQQRPLIHLSTQRTDPSNRTADNKAYPGHFVDVRAAAYAFSDREHTLESACAAFGVERPKRAYRREYGVLTAEYFDYNRDDVGATYRLYQKLAAEHARHPVDLPLTQCLSPAAIGKAYLRKTGSSPGSVSARLPLERFGEASTAYYHGRAECRVLLAEVPVSYLDVSSMYPLVFSLGKLWRWVICRRLRVVPCRLEATALLRSADFEQLLYPAIWPSIAVVFCRIRPSVQLLPVRAPYSATGCHIVSTTCWMRHESCGTPSPISSRTTGSEVRHQRFSRHSASFPTVS